MTQLVCSGEWDFEGRAIPIFGGGDHRLYARLRDLCAAAGVDFGEQLHAVGENRLLARDLVTFGEPCPRQGAIGPQAVYEIYLNLGAMSVWLGTLDPREVDDRGKRERLIRFRGQFRELFWMLIKTGFVVSPPR